jgi:hypothetical protein
MNAPDDGSPDDDQPRGGGQVFPISDEQAKALQEAFKTLQGLGGFLKKTFGTVPEDLVGLLGGDLLKVRRLENLARITEKARERLKARRVDDTEPPSISILLPIIVAAADEDRDELQDIWARLLAAGADPARAKSFRLAFVDAIKQMDPLDAAVLGAVGNGIIDGNKEGSLANQMHQSRDEIEVSIANLVRLELLGQTRTGGSKFISAFGREFLRVVSD